MKLLVTMTIACSVALRTEKRKKSSPPSPSPLRMTDNRTTQAVREETNLAPRYKAICEKYLRMEEALHMIAFQTNKLPAKEIVSGMESIAMDALAFDPLRMTPDEITGLTDDQLIERVALLMGYKKPTNPEEVEAGDIDHFDKKERTLWVWISQSEMRGLRYLDDWNHTMELYAAMQEKEGTAEDAIRLRVALHAMDQRAICLAALQSVSSL